MRQARFLEVALAVQILIFLQVDAIIGLLAQVRKWPTKFHLMFQCRKFKILERWLVQSLVPLIERVYTLGKIRINVLFHLVVQWFRDSQIDL